MSFYKVTTQAKLSQASPSVSLEKGAYRIRAPPKRSGLASGFSLRPDGSPSRLRTRTRRGSQGTSRDGLVHVYQQDKRLAMLVIVLVCATVACFAGAYYLFTTRYVAGVCRLCAWSEVSSECVARECCWPLLLLHFLCVCAASIVRCGDVWRASESSDCQLALLEACAVLACADLSVSM